VSGLLGLGVGFDVELSGVENILLGGAFLGLDDARVKQLLPSIVEFRDEIPKSAAGKVLRGKLMEAV